MKTYLYLLRKNKKDFKLLTVLASQPVQATKIDNLNYLDLPKSVVSEIDEIIHQYRMDWELWIESANNFDELRTSIERRGVSNMPSTASPIHNSYSYTDPYVISTDNIKQKNTMIRRGK